MQKYPSKSYFLQTLTQRKANREEDTGLRAVPRHHYRQANFDYYKQNQRFPLSDIGFERVDTQSAWNQSVAAPGPVTP